MTMMATVSSSIEVRWQGRRASGVPAVEVVADEIAFGLDGRPLIAALVLVDQRVGAVVADALRGL